MTNIIVTGADEAFAPLLLDLLDSLDASPAKPFDALGILDVGLAAATVEKLRPRVDRIVEPSWDLPVGPELRRSKPYLRALVARPFLRDYFPGHDTYLWMDSDTWVQEGFALDWFFHAAKFGEIGLASHLDRSYRLQPIVAEWRAELLKMSFSDAGSELHVMQQYYNAGVFSLRSDTPHWAAWEKWLRIALDALPQVVCDQTALNYAVWKEDLPVHPLPALANWCCHLAAPALSSAGRLTEPFIPRRTIGIVHLSANTKDRVIKAEIGGRRVSRSLRYAGSPPVVQPPRPIATRPTG